MTREIDELQHPDSIWTWKGGDRQKRAALWLPYFQEVGKVKSRKGKDVFNFRYNGGEFETPLGRLDSIMLYGATGQLPVEFLDRLSVHGIPLLIHRRNISKPYLFMPGYGAPTSDILSRQILFRENDIRRVYIARTFIRERFKNFENKINLPQSIYTRLSRTRSLKSMRALEAQVTKRYWKNYFQEIGFDNINRRDKQQPVNSALDAGSFFLFAVLLRWVLVHRLSPWHGFMHEPINYPALCYDLLEPCRQLIEDSVAECIKEGGNVEALTAHSLARLKDKLQEPVYVAATRQYVARKNLIHGFVLALRSYLMGESQRLILPVEGRRQSGRPPKVGYRLPGSRKQVN